MPTEFLIAILSGLGSMLGWGFADFFAKKTIDKIGDVTTLFWCQLVGIFPLLILFFTRPSIPDLGGLGFFYLAFLGVWSGLSYIPTYIAFGKGKVSLLSPIFATYAVIVAILSALFFREIIPFSRQISFVIVFLGILLINGDPRNFWSAISGREYNSEGKIEGLREIFIAICMYSLWLIALDHFIGNNYWVPFLLTIRIFSTLALYFYAGVRNIKLTFSNKSLWKFIILIGVFDVAAFAALSYGFSKTSYTSIVTMLGAIFSLPTIILARIFLKEKMTRIQLAGSFVILIGIILLSLL